MVNSIPDFFIVGATKSGTTTLSHILNHSSKVYCPEEKELRFLDRDELNQKYFMLEYPEKWSLFDWENRKDELLKEYKKKFSKSSPNQMIYEASAYMYSKKAAKRIYDLNDDAKLIFMLRNPIDRAYSHYWHLVRVGKAVYKFEDQIKYESDNLLTRGHYEDHIRNYLEYFDKSQIKYIIFESFIKNLQKSVDQVLNFLEINDNIHLNEIDTHQNPARVPRYLKLHLIFNKILRRYLGKKYTNNVIVDENEYRSKIKTMIENTINNISLTEKKYPRMKTSTRKILREYFSRENSNLSTIIDKEVSKYWDLDI